MNDISSKSFESAEGAIKASAAEWEVRVDLAAMFRLTQLFAETDVILGHDLHVGIGTVIQEQFGRVHGALESGDEQRSPAELVAELAVVID